MHIHQKLNIPTFEIGSGDSADQTANFFMVRLAIEKLRLSFLKLLFLKNNELIIATLNQNKVLHFTLFGQEVEYVSYYLFKQQYIQLVGKQVLVQALFNHQFFFQEQRCLDGSLDHGCQSQASMILNLAGQMFYELLQCV